MTRSIVRQSIAALACLWLAGCLSMDVMQRATHPRYRFGRMTEITDAAVVGKDVFVQVSVLRPGRIDPEPVVLKIATDEKYWASAHSVPAASHMEGVLLAHVPADALLAPGTIPKGGTRLPVESIEITHLGALKDLGRTPSRDPRVLEIHYRPTENDLRAFWDLRRGVPIPEDPLLAIIGQATKGEPNTILISDIQDGHTTRRPWLILMPLAAAADSVLLPIEFIGAMIAAE